MRITKLFIGTIILLVTLASVLPQDDFIQSLIKKVSEYKTKSPHVKIFLTFNQSTYTPGDTAFFAAHFMSADLIPISGRQILRVELLNHLGEIMSYQYIAVKDGMGANQLVIPANLLAGRYQWVSYSNYMRNFDPQFYFRQSFDLVIKSELEADRKQGFTMDVFPEGGSFIEGIQNKMIVSTSDPGITSFKIMEDNVMLGENSVTNGLGFCLITPQAGKVYAIQYINAGQTKQQSLPKARQDGYSLIVSGRDPVQAVVHASKGARLENENLWLVVSAQSEIFSFAQLKFGEVDQIPVQLPTKELPTGIALLTLFNDKGVVLAERQIYNLSKPSASITITKDKGSYTSREPVSLSLKLEDEQGNPLAGSFSLSVLNKILFKNENTYLSEVLYLQLYSDLSTKVNLSNYTHDELNLFLATQRNERMDWASILRGVKSLKYPFRQMVQYSGRALNAETGKPVSDSTRIITYLKRNMMGYEVYTDKNGLFDLEFLFDFWNDDEIFYLMENKRGNEIAGRIDWIQDTLRLTTSPVSESPRNSAYGEYQFRKRLIDQSYNFYSTSKIKNEFLLGDPNADFEDEIGKADVSVNVQDYVVFPTMVELIREIVPSLQHRRSGGKSTVRVVLTQNGIVPTNDPLYLIDGVMTKSTNYFLQLKTNEVISIKVIKDLNKLNRLGSLGKNGIVMVYTKKDSHPELLIQNTQISVKGLNKTSTYYLPSSSDHLQLRKPDFRSNLYWNPMVKTNASGEAIVNFNTSDDVGTFIIRIQGITRDGRPFEKIDSLGVTFSKN